MGTFDLRLEALRRRSEMRQSPVRGFLGGRVDLLPHQMYIAGEVTSRLSPRVLLADEVGLGKTIEAGLILHRLHLTGRADRVLILLPEPLIHQWFVELLRRFNLLFSLFDEERCAAIELHNPEANPFLDSQLVICGIEFLAENPERGAQVRDAGWDLLIVDEAHHLEWHPDAPSAAYSLVDSIARQNAGLLLLTATPQQLGPEGHFARLRLLDPDRYADLGEFRAESEHYEQVAKAIDRLLAGKALTKKERTLFAEKSEHLRRLSDALDGGDKSARDQLVTQLLDEFGTGRVMFRNTRAGLTGFPERQARLISLDPVSVEMDVKMKWLGDLVRQLKGEKILLICRTRELAEEIHRRLPHEINVNCGVFHEGLTLLQRDRNAAFFAEEEGARILVCSEIGSEGRNFQFAHHLVLFDLPEDPELLEQRIGRLDRIGQTSTITIHVPYLRGSDGEIVARWYHEGLNAFEANLHGATELLAALQKDLASVRTNFAEAPLGQLIEKTRRLRAQVAKKLERGHDRLLELNSCKPEIAADMVKAIRTADDDVAFEEFVLRLLDHFGVAVEDLGSRSYLLQPGHLITDAFPSLPEEGLSATLDRTRALSREDLQFMSQDHPVVRSALDLLLGSEAGNSAFGVWRGGGAEAILLEVISVVECIAPASLHVDRFLPATPVRVAVDHALADLSEDAALQGATLEKGDVFRLLDKGVVKRKFIPSMLEKANTVAEEKLAAIVMSASGLMSRQLDREIERLEVLREINDHVRPEEITATRAQKEALRTAITGARLRVDAVRLIFRMPAV